MRVAAPLRFVNSADNVAAPRGQILPESKQNQVTASGEPSAALVKLVLSVAALISLHLEPTVGNFASAPAAIFVLYLYVLLNSVVWLVEERSSLVRSFGLPHFGPVDFAIYLLLNVLTQPSNLILFCALLVSVVCISVRYGATLSYRLLLCSLPAVIGSFIYYRFTRGPDPNQSELLLNWLMVLAVGCAAAWWGGRQWKVKRQALLLKNISHISNPRFGVERSLWIILDQVREFYDAESCLLVLRENDQYSIQKANRGRSSPRVTRPQTISAAFGRQVLGSSPDLGFLWPAGMFSKKTYAYNIGERTGAAAWDNDCRRVANLLDAKAFISLPFKMAHDAEARVYLISRKWERFQILELDFLREAVNSFVPVIENIRLVDRLASEAAAVERKRIARDLHDSTIQPVIGLQFGLMAIAQKLAAGPADVRPEVESLLQLTDNELGSLRQYVHVLHGGESKVPGLVSALESFIKRFKDSSGIDVNLVISHDFSITDRLAAEVFQMIAEALSNIRRHTKSSRALVALSCGNDQFSLHVQNDNHVGAAVDFCPRSLSERTNALGGRLTVAHSHDGSTDLNITIPL